MRDGEVMKRDLLKNYESKFAICISLIKCLR